MNVIKAIGTALLIVLIVLLTIFLAVAIGYFFGYILTILPLVSGWLTGALPITATQIPAITAWLAVASLFIGGTSKVKAEASE